MLEQIFSDVSEVMCGVCRYTLGTLVYAICDTASDDILNWISRQTDAIDYISFISTSQEGHAALLHSL